ncbi:MAG TPA: YidC/Oxa1 family insertase periplasmic-domain containing protein, partial [Elusimicrobiales bacterium]|nr:YidC/Oxa1 family insertase periplasmic-domain containing protein [Elusimicrobiales bacterium]
MNRNLILAVLLSSAVYIFWYSYVAKPPMPQPNAAAQTDPQPAAPAPSASVKGPAAEPSAPAAPAAASDWPRNGVTLDMPKASYSFHPAGASIKSIVYQGPVSPVELIPAADPGFLSSFEGLRFALKSRTGDSVTFAARAANGVNITKKYTLSADDTIHLLEVTAANPETAPAVLGPWTLTIGPGIGTVKTEQKENPSVWKAKYTFQEPGKKHPTVVEMDENAKAGDWIWAGVDNRYFLTAVLGGGLQRDQLIFSHRELEGNKAPLLTLPFDTVVLAPRESRTWKVSFYAGPKDYRLLQALGSG